jgi:hypothetical protein
MTDASLTPELYGDFGRHRVNISPRDLQSAMSFRYAATFKVIPLPSGLWAIFGNGHQLLAVLPPEGMSAFFASPPPFQSPSEPPARHVPALDLLRELGL